MKTINVYYGHIIWITINANDPPKEQLKQLNFLINELKDGQQLDVFTNSPYVINELTLLSYQKKILLGEVIEYQMDNSGRQVKVPVVLYEASNGSKMIPDDNLLNDSLGQFNERFAKILEDDQRRT